MNKVLNKIIPYRTVDLNGTTYYCLNCEQAVGQHTIACEECDSWYHYECVGLTHADVVKINKDIPYICDNFNENQLYGKERTDVTSQVDISVSLNVTDVVESQSQPNLARPLGTAIDKTSHDLDNELCILVNTALSSQPQKVSPSVVLSKVNTDSTILIEDTMEDLHATELKHLQTETDSNLLSQRMLHSQSTYNEKASNNRKKNEKLNTFSNIREKKKKRLLNSRRSNLLLITMNFYFSSKPQTTEPCLYGTKLPNAANECLQRFSVMDITASSA